MTKKHFIALADALRAMRNDIPKPNSKMPSAQSKAERYEAGYVSGLTAQHHLIVSHLVALCKESNPRFKADRWLAYINGECGPNGGKL